MELNRNPLLFDQAEPEADLTAFTSPAVHRRQRSNKLDVRDARRMTTAAEAIGPLDQTTEVYGFTKGQFSIVDIVNHVLDCIGPAHLDISTWTAANTDVSTVLAMVDAGRLTSSRWLVDLTFNRRAPALAQRIRNVFGDDAIRVAKNHAKFVLLANADWQVVIRTSMNLNFNPRFENFQLAHDPELHQFHKAILDEVWQRQSRSVQDARPYEVHKHFEGEL